MLRNNLDAVVMMHSQIEVLIQQLFNQEIIRNLIKRANETVFNMYDISDDETLGERQLAFPKLSRKLKQTFESYLMAIFPDKYQAYKNFTSTYKEIKSIKKSNIVNSPTFGHEEEEEEEEDEEEEEFRGLLEEEDQSEDEKELEESEEPDSNDEETRLEKFQLEQQLNLINRDKNEEASQGTAKDSTAATVQTDSNDEKYRFIATRTEHMDSVEWNYFMQSRATTFLSLGKQQLLQFVDFDNIGLCYQHLVSGFSEVISYALCKVVAQIVEQIIRSRSKSGQLCVIDKPLTSEEVKIIGNEIITKYIKHGKKFALQKQKFIKQAYKIFCKEFQDQNYDKLLLKDKVCQIKLRKTNSGSINFNEIEEPVENTSEKNKSYYLIAWKNLKNYRKMWVERVIAERQVLAFIARRKTQPITQLKPVNQYAKYLQEKIWEDKPPLNEIKFPYYFKRWFLNQESQRSSSQKPILIDTPQPDTPLFPKQSLVQAEGRKRQSIDEIEMQSKKNKLVKFQSIYD